MNQIDQIAEEAADKIMYKQIHRGLIRDVAYRIIKSAIEKATLCIERDNLSTRLLAIQESSFNDPDPLDERPNP